jgi:hypothetical protein
VIRFTVILGLVGALAASAASGVPSDLPALALGSATVLMAERTFALFAIWMAIVVVVSRAMSDQLPVEVGGRGLRYAEAQSVRSKTHRTDEALREMDSDIRWLRKAVADLLSADPAEERGAEDG